ncbi:MAG: hypothetical protein ACKOCU_10075, partial [Betaproteobacteria bacterium]
MSSPFNSTKARPTQLGSQVAVLWGLVMVLGLCAGPCWSQAAPAAKATAPAGTGGAPAKAARAQEPVTLNFVNAEIESVAR